MKLSIKKVFHCSVKKIEDKGEIPFSRHTSILATRANYSEAISSIMAKLEMAKNFHLPRFDIWFRETFAV